MIDVVHIYLAHTGQYFSGALIEVSCLFCCALDGFGHSARTPSRKEVQQASSNQTFDKIHFS